ncbi:ribbon-helix-helix domain-containing protein [Caulobacter sp. 17J80-11]|uniref:ribbon-helix-helix domain-containing protein n=1 Tax=Caulobacter sp. 17J80-11 TaxID=2763502 RepID=UPI00165349F7|nr:ribbon-helix-helix domain-containing protein [Caulobacter sp. 17J80-11]MBC6983079.1 ribbon-helix-helix domain-containing protein [Caulobacter sp. 17J80-11]
MVNLKKRSVSLAGHATSLALEPEFWAVLEDMAQARGLSLAGLILALDAGRGRRPLASACRVSALAWIQAGGAVAASAPGEVAEG